MKTSFSVVVLAGLLIAASASFGQSRTYPSTTSRTPVASAPAPVFNLNGTWRFTTGGKTYDVQFDQHSQQFRMFGGVGNIGVPDAFLFEGRYANASIAGQGVTATNTRVAETFSVEDPDHIRTSRGVVIVRISPARADDAVCDLQNSSHTQAGYAYDRAIDAAHRNLPNTLSACWLQVSANQGHARAEAVMAMTFRDGEGVPRNYNTAFSWAEKSAKQGDAIGEAVLGQLYGSGLGTPRNLQLSQYWESKANTQLAAARAQQQRPVARVNSNNQAPSAADRDKALATLAVIILGSAGSPEVAPNPSLQNRDRSTITDEETCVQAGGKWVSHLVFPPYYSDDHTPIDVFECR